MSSAQDPFYIVKEEIQDSIDKLLSTFHEWQGIPSDTGKKVQLSKALLTGCESIQWQVDELDKAISVAARDPAFYGINAAELERRRKWTKSAHDKVGTVLMTVGKGLGYQDASSVNGTHRELMRYPMDYSQQKASSSEYTPDNDDFMSSESDRQLLLMKHQDQELDELSASVQRIGHVGLTIHNELTEQERIMNDLGAEIDSTSNRLEFLQVHSIKLFIETNQFVLWRYLIIYTYTFMIYAEKGRIRLEEGRGQGSVYDDSVLVRAFHNPIHSRLLHLSYKMWLMDGMEKLNLPADTVIFCDNLAAEVRKKENRTG